MLISELASIRIAHYNRLGPISPKLGILQMAVPGLDVMFVINFCSLIAAIVLCNTDLMMLFCCPADLWKMSPWLLQVCNHRFHNECLQRWGDLKCPVCRYCAQASSTTSHCSVCDTSQVGYSV